MLCGREAPLARRLAAAVRADKKAAAVTVNSARPNIRKNDGSATGRVYPRTAIGPPTSANRASPSPDRTIATGTVTLPPSPPIAATVSSVLTTSTAEAPAWAALSALATKVQLVAAGVVVVVLAGGERRMRAMELGGKGVGGGVQP